MTKVLGYLLSTWSLPIHRFKKIASHMQEIYLYTPLGFPCSILPLNLNYHSVILRLFWWQPGKVQWWQEPCIPDCAYRSMHDQGHQCRVWCSIWILEYFCLDGLFFSLFGMMKSSKFYSKTVKLFILQAVLGGTVSVPTLTGNVTVKVCIHSYEVSTLFLQDDCQSLHTAGYL